MTMLKMRTSLKKPLVRKAKEQHRVHAIAAKIQAMVDRKWPKICHWTKA